MTPVCTCTLTPTVAHESSGLLKFDGIPEYHVHCRKIGVWRNAELHLTVFHGLRVIGEAVARQYADDQDLTKDIWGAEIVLNGYTWLVSGRVGSGVLEFASPSRPRTLADVEAEFPG